MFPFREISPPPAPALSASSPLEPDPPPRVAHAGKLLAGRYRGPIRDPRLESAAFKQALARRVRLKSWHYLSLTHERFFLGLGVVQLGYAGNVFLYVVDRHRPGRHDELSLVLPLARGLSFAPSSVFGRTQLVHRRGKIVLRGSDEGWDCHVDIRLPRYRLLADFAILREEESLGMLTALPSGWPAYTHKSAGLGVRGELHYGGLDAGRAVSLDGALAAVDWTRSYAERTTIWRWASLSGRDTRGRRVGLNLSSDVYDDAEGHSLENVAWIDGELRSLRGVRFGIPAAPDRDQWTIASLDSDEVSLRFRPLGVRREDLDLGLVKSRFIQPYGLFTGHIGDSSLDAAFGVVEDHHSRW